MTHHVACAVRQEEEERWDEEREQVKQDQYPNQYLSHVILGVGSCPSMRGVHITNVIIFVNIILKL
jgi:hypothetical protein